jgi:signal transduction histidine kinase
MKSLRGRLLIGALLWTGAMALATHLLVMTAVSHHVSGWSMHYGAMSLFVFGLLAAGLTQVRIGLSPLARLRRRLAEVRQGRHPRVEGRFPTEVEPLVSDLNALLDDRERSVARAQAKAGDLAHGLKTPLAVLSQEAERAAAAGQAELAATIAQQVERMRRQVDYHLAHARAAASGATLGARSAVAPAVDGLVRTLRRLHAERGLAIDVRIPAEQAVRCQREDLEEMLGNLLDNACKWAASRVAVASAEDGGGVTLTVDDDGPGLEPSLREAVLQRGVRADEAAPGSGFGLAIVRDLAELYGGQVLLEGSPLGGLRARLRLPAPPR